MISAGPTWLSRVLRRAVACCPAEALRKGMYSLSRARYSNSATLFIGVSEIANQSSGLRVRAIGSMSLEMRPASRQYRRFRFSISSVPLGVELRKLF